MRDQRPSTVNRIRLNVDHSAGIADRQLAFVSSLANVAHGHSTRSAGKTATAKKAMAVGVAASNGTRL
jgi:hypothetical protein